MLKVDRPTLCNVLRLLLSKFIGQKAAAFDFSFDLSFMESTWERADNDFFLTLPYTVIATGRPD
jgi:hypothetical protein